MTRKKNLSILLTFLFVLFLHNLHAEEKMVISKWLTTDAHNIEMPVFSNTENTEGEVFEIKEILKFDHVSFDGHFPEEGKTLATINNSQLQWEETFSDNNGFVVLSDEEKSNGIEASYLATYIETNRWTESTLEIKSAHMLHVWLNGESLGAKTTFEEEEKTLGKVTKELELKRGKHLLVIKALRTEESLEEWKVSAEISVKEPFFAHNFQVATDPATQMNIHHLMDGTKVSSVDLSHDGTFYKVSYSESQPPSDKTERWAEIKRTSDQTLVESFKGSDYIRLQWLPNSNRISFLNNQNNQTELLVLDLETQKIETIWDGIQKISGYTWSPSEDFIIYSVSEKGEGTDNGIRKIYGMEDRLPGFRDRSFLYMYDVTGNWHKRLTYGNLTTYLLDIHPTRKEILFGRQNVDYNQLPYSNQDLFSLDLENMSLDTIWKGKLWINGVQYSPDGEKLLVSGGPSAFGEIGENVPKGMTPNNYETQAYIFDLKKEEVTPLTKKFKPSLNNAYWHKNGTIYMDVEEKDFRRIYAVNPDNNRKNLLTGSYEFSMINSYAPNAPLIAFKSNQANEPPKVYLMNTETNNPEISVLEDTESHNYRNVDFGEVKPWTFKASNGYTIDGRVYYPPDFSDDKKYPVIVYYYGGTSPVGRSFGGRYPYNIWAANDYLVYVLQPSGAPGYGQEFAARHVNTWGMDGIDEIIEGTQKFLDEHPYADPDKVGCAGASYGGFMTMLLMTKTDMFAAAVSHAGISSISSYWGEGYWGYTYSAVASAGSFPWNNKELYIDQSPLFNADRVNTPLMLVTGDSDTNVPPGESYQFYAALKLLDKPVALITVKDQDHHILKYNRRIEWHNAIMGWWDKYLKDQPQWWESQFPEKNY